MDSFEIGVLIFCYIAVAGFVKIFLGCDYTRVNGESERRVKVTFWPLFALYYLPKWGLWLAVDIIKGVASILSKPKTKG